MTGGTGRVGGAGPLDLFLDLRDPERGPGGGRTADRAGHVRLAAAVRRAVLAGRLVPGARLPSTRALAADLGCSRWVVTEAYRQLVAEGWCEAVVGSGTRVRAVDTEAAGAAVAAGTAGRAGDRGPAVRYDLAPGVPDLATFPRRAWLDAMHEALLTASAEVLGSEDPRGAWPLRAVLAGYLARVRGVRTTPDAVVVCAGVCHGVTLLARIRAAEGAADVGVEEPGWPRLRLAVEAAGARAVDVPVDAGGVRVDALAATGADTVVVAPAHQFPTGVTLDADRRAALIGWARDRSGLVVEDDYDAEFRYGRRPVGALQPDGDRHVAYLGSLSKTLSPAPRVGWLVPPPRLATPVADLLLATGSRPSTLEQLALARLIETGAYDRHLRRTRQVYRRRRDALLAALGDRLPRAAVTGVPAGLHVVVTPDGTHDEAAVVARAAAAGLRLTPLGRYRHAVDAPAAFVLGYAAITERAIPAAVARLADALG